MGEIESLAMWLYEYFDTVSLCLDVGDTIQPQLGFECFYKIQRGVDPRLSKFLEQLESKGMCTAEKRKAILAWPEVLAPENQAEQWPDHLIAQSIMRAEDQFTVLDCRFSHIKVVYHPNKPLVAKGYFGYVYNWM